MWRRKAWGLDLHSGTVHHALSAVESGYLGIEIAAQFAAEHSEELSVRVDMQQRSLAFRVAVGGEGEPWLDSKVRLPEHGAVRPWVLFPDETLGDEVRLLSHERWSCVDSVSALGI